MRKVTALLAGGVGYVLGARAGRERYEQIKNAATRVKSNPKVQQAAQRTADAAKDAAPVVKDKVSSAADTATTKARSSSSQGAKTRGPAPSEGSAYPAN